MTACGGAELRFELSPWVGAYIEERFLDCAASLGVARDRQRAITARTPRLRSGQAKILGRSARNDSVDLVE